MLYTFKASDFGQLTLICIVSFWLESELTTIVTSCTFGTFLSNVKLPEAVTEPDVYITPL